MKRIFFLTAITFMASLSYGQLVTNHGGEFISENANSPVVDIQEIGRLITVASVEDGTLVVRRFYRGKWEQIGETGLTGIKKAVKVDLFNYKNTPYVFCFYDGKMSVVRSIADNWEYVGEETFGEGDINNPEFSVIGEKPYILYEDKDYEMIRMISLLDDSWYDVDLIENTIALDYKLGASMRGDLFFAYADGSALRFKKVDQETEITEWPSLTKAVKIENINEIFDFEFVENKAYITYPNALGSPVIMTLNDGEDKWETVEELEAKVNFGGEDINLVISEYFYFTATNSTSKMPQFLKNNKKGNWGDVTNLSLKKGTCVASTEYLRIIYVAYVEFGTGKLVVKKIEKGEEEDEREKREAEEDKKGKKKK
jgi:hypothetical protein